MDLKIINYILRNRKDKNEGHHRLKVILFVLTFLLLINIYYLTPWSKLSKINVSRNFNTRKNEIITASKLHINKNWWIQYFLKHHYEKHIKKNFSRIKHVQIQHREFNTFFIKIKEYKEIALIKKKKKWFSLLENNKLVEYKKKNFMNKLLLKGFNNEKIIISTIQEYKKLSPSMKKKISKIFYTPRKKNDQLLTIILKDGNKIIVNIYNLSEQLKYYPKIYKTLEKKGTIDMEVGIFFYPY